MKPKSLAETPGQATNEVRQWLIKFANTLDGTAMITKFFECDPHVNDVQNTKGDIWYEAGWGVDLIIQRFNIMDFHHAARSLPAEISIDDFTAYPRDDKTITVRLWITAPVERWC